MEDGIMVTDTKPPIRDVARWRARWRVEKFLGDFKEAKDIPTGLTPYEVIHGEGNLMLNEGINELWTILCSSGGTKWDNSNARIGVGNSNTAAAATQTDLQGGSKLFKGMDASFPTYGTSQKATWKATFSSSEGNWAWEEWSIDNGAVGLKNLNRKVESLGTKVSGTTWVFTVDVTLS